MKRVRQLAAVLILFGFIIIPSICAHDGDPESIATRLGEEAKSMKGDTDKGASAAVTRRVDLRRHGEPALRISIPYSQVNETTRRKWELMFRETLKQSGKAITPFTTNENYTTNPRNTGSLLTGHPRIHRRRRRETSSACEDPVIETYDDENGNTLVYITCPGLTLDQVNEEVRRLAPALALRIGVPLDRIIARPPPTTPPLTTGDALLTTVGANSADVSYLTTDSVAMASNEKTTTESRATDQSQTTLETKELSISENLSFAESHPSTLSPGMEGASSTKASLMTTDKVTAVSDGTEKTTIEFQATDQPQTTWETKELNISGNLGFAESPPSTLSPGTEGASSTKASLMTTDKVTAVSAGTGNEVAEHPEAVESQTPRRKRDVDCRMNGCHFPANLTIANEKFRRILTPSANTTTVSAYAEFRCRLQAAPPVRIRRDAEGIGSPQVDAMTDGDIIFHISYPGKTADETLDIVRRRLPEISAQFGIPVDQITIGHNDLYSQHTEGWKIILPFIFIITAILTVFIGCCASDKWHPEQPPQKKPASEKNRGKWVPLAASNLAFLPDDIPAKDEGPKPVHERRKPTEAQPSGVKRSNNEVMPEGENPVSLKQKAKPDVENTKL